MHARKTKQYVLLIGMSASPGENCDALRLYERARRACSFMVGEWSSIMLSPFRTMVKMAAASGDGVSGKFTSKICTGVTRKFHPLKISNVSGFVIVNK